MPNTICAVFGCHNSKRKLKLWAEEFCNLHEYNFNVGACDCEPPFRLHVFPSEKVDPDARKRWTKNINRMDSKSGKIWTPTADSRVCSIHFPEGKPTTKDPDPVLHLGHDKIQSVTPTRRKLNRYSDTNAQAYKEIRRSSESVYKFYIIKKCAGGKGGGTRVVTKRNVFITPYLVWINSTVRIEIGNKRIISFLHFVNVLSRRQLKLH